MTAVLYTWGLSRDGMANSYYAAAVRSGATSWKAFFFGALDPGSFITVDKPPAALWVMYLSARVFGFSSWSMLLPEAAAGVGSVLILHRLVRRWAGELSAHLAALALAVTPVAVLMFRFNNPDAFLTLVCLGAAWALWSALETGRTRWLLLAGALVGLGFETKMLQAFLIVPAMAIVYLWAGPPRLGRRIAQLAAAGVALVVSAGWWVAIVALWPAASRPYIGSTTDNSDPQPGVRLQRLRPHPRHLVGARQRTGEVSGSAAAPVCCDCSATRSAARSPGSSRSPGRPGRRAVAHPPGPAHRQGPGRLVAVGRLGGGVPGGVQPLQGHLPPVLHGAMAPAVAALAGAGAVALWQVGRQHHWSGGCCRPRSSPPRCGPPCCWSGPPATTVARTHGRRRPA